MLVLVPVGLSGQRYWLTVLSNAALLSLGAMGVWLTFAIGRINIAQGAFALIGGYVTAILATRVGSPIWLFLPASALAAALAGGLLGWPILRLKGVYFAMITLSLTAAVQLLFLNGGALTNGAAGINNIPRPAILAGNLRFYLASVLFMLAGIAVIWRFDASRLGQVFRSMRQSEDLAWSVGIDVARYRILAFVVSSAMGGIAGAMFAVSQQSVFPSSYTVNDSVNFMLYCFLGGLDFVAGPVFGTFLLVLAFQFLGVLQTYQALLFGIFMIACMLFRPNGLLSLLPPLVRSLRPGTP
jgi:branched-chain amino acid transport system permease protein